MSSDIPARDTPFKFWISKTHKRVKSVDSRLSTDGTALHKFLVAQLSEPPKVFLLCRGFHTETYNDNDGIEQTREAVRFISQLHLTPLLKYDPAGANPTTPPIWILGDGYPAYRGGRFLQIDEALVPSDDVEKGGFSGEERRRRLATDAEHHACAAHRKQRASMGLPPWALLNDMKRAEQVCLESEDDYNRLQDAAYIRFSKDDRLQPSSRTLRDWADEYCASWKPFREFYARKAVYGWNMVRLVEEVRALLDVNKGKECERVSVELVMEEAVIVVHGGWLGRTITQSGWLRFLLWITFIYPLVVVPIKYLFGGYGQWSVAGSAFALIQWVHLEDSLPGETVEEYRERATGTSDPSSGESATKATPKGISRLRGALQDDWFESKKQEIVNGIKLAFP